MIELFEAPIQDWSVDPDFDRNEDTMVSKFHGYSQEQLHWSPQDKIAINSPKNIQKIKTSFLKTSFKLNLYFWQADQPDYDKYLEHGIVTPEWIKKNMGNNVLSYIEKQHTNDAITIIMTNNLSDEQKIPLNGSWILAHRIAHVLAGRQNSFGAEFRACFEQLIESIILKVYGYKLNDWHQSIYEDEIEMFGKMLGQYIGTMKSARNNKFVTGYEWFFETFAQYIIQGKITFNDNLPAHFTKYMDADSEHLELGKKIIRAFEKKINQVAEKTIKKSIGHIFVM